MQSVSSRIWTRVAVSISCEDNHYTTVHTFPKGSCPKVNVIARLDFEPAYYDFEFHRFSLYTPINTWNNLTVCQQMIDNK